MQLKLNGQTGKSIAAAAAVGLAAAVAAPASATVNTLVLDTFQASPSTSNALAGSTADIGGTWSALNNVSNGSAGTSSAVITPPANSNAGYVTVQTTGTNGNFVNTVAPLAITPSGNGLLTLEANITYNNASEWAAIGFAPNTSGANPNSTGEPWMLISTASGGYQMFEGPGTANKALGVSTSGYTGTTTVEMTYNLASGQVELLLGKGANAATLTTVGGFTYATLPAAPGAIFLGVRGVLAPATFSNLSLTQVATPEPASLGLFAIGGLGLLLAGRRKIVRSES